MSPRPTILLFDVDGTLIESGGAGRRAIELAFEQAFGRRDACAHVRFGGMTDRAIVRAGLTAIGAPIDEATIEAFLARYLEVLRDTLASTSGWRVHTGIVEALDAAATRRLCAVGLGTGNVRLGAELKLSRVGLAGRFAFGGFGCDHEIRAELLRVGAARGSARLGFSLEACRVVVIGDTTKDVAAAHEIGAECVAVATGAHDAATLRDSAPRFVFDSLAEPGAIDALLDG